MENNEEAMLVAVERRDISRVVELIKEQGVDVNFASGEVRMLYILLLLLVDRKYVEQYLITCFLRT